MKEWFALALIIALTLIPSFAVAALTAKSIAGWYQHLKKPRWTPPNWLFGPVWTVLYLSMSVALWLVWKEDPENLWALRLYFAQLALNQAWSPTFFLLRRPDYAFIVIVVLWFAIVATTAVFALTSLTAAKLMVPYLLWVSFATLLNYRIWRDNRIERG